MKLEEIISKYTDKEFISTFINLYGLKYFLNNCIIDKNYDFSNLNCNSIVLSESGLQLLEELKQGKYSTCDENILKLGIFLKFYTVELLIDVKNFDYKSFAKSVNDEIIKKHILFPWIYGRTLYDKYFNEFEDQVSSLNIDNVLKLLKDTPIGVFQLGSLVVGPLGIQHSEHNRILPPTTRVKLWHCSDPTCNALHSVKLLSAETIISEVLAEIDELTDKEDDSEWFSFYNKQVEKENTFYDDIKIDDLPITLVYTFGEKELKYILKEIIDKKENARSKLPHNKKFQGSSETIVLSLSKAECFQVILLYSSYDILYYTEKLIAEKTILIPSTEIRYSLLQKSGGFFNIFHECNKLGFRSKSSNTQLSLINLRNLILNLYDDERLHQQLEWDLRAYNKDSLKERIEEYINTEEPRKIIRETVFSGLYQINKTFDILKGYFKMPTTPAEEELIIDKVLWKLGFNINIFPPFLEVFEERLAKFKKTISIGTSYGESDKEKIRSCAVNLFVSLEEILKHSLAFTTWVLLSDHLKNTRFKYNYAQATLFMTEILNGYKLNEETELIFDSNGKNTLYPLVEGFTALFGICDALLNEDKEKHKRNEAELPRFIGKTNLIDFPLFHDILLLDIKTSSYQSIREIGLKLTTEFNKNKVLSVRNSLEHDRDDFPLKSDLINACDCLQNTIEDIKISGIFPNVYLFKSLIKDKHNRVIKTFEDYSGKEITISELINYKGYPVPSTDNPIVILPTINFPETIEPIRFKYEENSEYLFYWKNYPRKKHKIIEKKDENYSNN